MEGFSKPARIREVGIMDTLADLVDRAEFVVTSAVGEQIEEQRDQMRAQAAQHEQWQAIAGDIDTWEDQDGNAGFGVRDESPAAVQAGLAEYGSDTDPPTALVRMGVLSQVADIGWSLTDTFRGAGL